jgi:hypothetical protein
MEIQHLVEDADVNHKSSPSSERLGGQARGGREEEGGRRSKQFTATDPLTKHVQAD